MSDVWRHRCHEPDGARTKKSCSHIVHAGKVGNIMHACTVCAHMHDPGACPNTLMYISAVTGQLRCINITFMSCETIFMYTHLLKVLGYMMYD